MGHDPKSPKTPRSPNLVQWVVRYGVLVVKTKVHAAADEAWSPQLAPLKLYCYRNLKGAHCGEPTRGACKKT
eukprot:107803-Pelagomonas_calceolata.AAC.3